MAEPEVQIFSVRLWSEDLGDGRREWRGQVRHASSGETRYFREWPALVAFLQDALPDLTDDLRETTWRPSKATPFQQETE